MAKILIVEWDGKQPPTTWYNRLKYFNIYGGKPEKGKGWRLSSLPEERRAFRGKYYSPQGSWQATHAPNTWSHYGKPGEDYVGTVAQEGVIITSSDAMTEYLAQTALDLGARSVHIVDSELTKFTPSKDSVTLAAKIEERIGRRGRPSTIEDMPYVVTCLEEGLSAEVENFKLTICCPNCSSPKVSARPGNLVKVYSTTKTVFERWSECRFFVGQFENSPVDTSGSEVYSPLRRPLTKDHEEKTLALIEASTELLDRLAKTDDQIAFEALDRVFIARTYDTKEHRINRRVNTASRLFMRGVDSKGISMIERDDKVDILDTALSTRNDFSEALFMLTR